MATDNYYNFNNENPRYSSKVCIVMLRSIIMCVYKCLSHLFNILFLSFSVYHIVFLRFTFDILFGLSKSNILSPKECWLTNITTGLLQIMLTRTCSSYATPAREFYIFFKFVGFFTGCTV